MISPEIVCILKFFYQLKYDSQNSQKSVLHVFCTYIFACINTLKKEIKYEQAVFSFFFFFVSFISNVVFVYNRLKQSLILQTKPNCFLQISSFHMILTFILKKHLAPHVETWVQVCYYACHVCLHLWFCFTNLH